MTARATTADGWVLERGQEIFDQYGSAKIMAIEAGYAMVRRNGCMPFTVKVSDVNDGDSAKWKTEPPKP